MEHPITVTLQDLLEQYEQRTYPITLVCAGSKSIGLAANAEEPPEEILTLAIDRRKEQNIVHKSKGFNWVSETTARVAQKTSSVFD